MKNVGLFLKTKFEFLRHISILWNLLHISVTNLKIKKMGKEGKKTRKERKGEAGEGKKRVGRRGGGMTYNYKYKLRVLLLF